MPVTDPRVIPLTSVRVYEKGNGDALLLDRGWEWYSILQNEADLGTVTYNNGVPALEFIPGVGLVCRAFFNLQDTTLNWFVTSGGSWEQRRPDYGYPRAYRLVQYNTTANVTYAATSLYSLPVNPQIAFSFKILAPPPDETVTVPYARVEFGGGLWAIDFNRLYGNNLLQNINGVWQVAMQLPDASGLGNAEGDEALVFVRCLRGQICISCDGGRTYQNFAEPDGSIILVNGTPITFRGAGCMAVFGVHQLANVSAVFASAQRNTFTNRVFLPSATITARDYQPTGTSITYTDISVPQLGTAQYQATFAPKIASQLPWNMYWTPELYSVNFYYPQVFNALFLNYTTPWDGSLLECEIDKPIELADTSCKLRIRKDATTSIDIEQYRNRKVEVYSGDDQAGKQIVFTGYIENIRTRQGEHRKQFIEIDLANRSYRLKTQSFDDFTLPLGNNYLSAALDHILLRGGLTQNDRLWWPTMFNIPVPPGLAEDPSFWPKAGELLWDKLFELCDQAGFELGVNDAGQIIAVPKNYLDTVLDYTWNANPASDGVTSIQSADYEFKSGDSYTCVIARGKDANGLDIFAFGVDSQAENNPLSPRFSPWRKTYNVNVPGTVSLGWLLQVVQSYFADKIPLRLEAEIAVPLNLSIGRRYRIQVTGLTQGIVDNDLFTVMSLTHHIKPAIGDCSTRVGIRRSTLE